MFALIIVAEFFVGPGTLITASRAIFAYSRDGALPGSSWLSQVSKNKTPVNSVVFVVVMAALFGLMVFAGPIAIGALFSITGIAQYVAFVTPLALKLFVSGDKFRPGKDAVQTISNS
jgi:amino acid transporter